MKNARAKRAKILFFTVKYANLWGFCCRRRRGCLSSLIYLKRRINASIFTLKPLHLPIKPLPNVVTIGHDTKRCSRDSCTDFKFFYVPFLPVPLVCLACLLHRSIHPRQGDRQTQIPQGDQHLPWDQHPRSSRDFPCFPDYRDHRGCRWLLSSPFKKEETLFRRTHGN